MHVHGAPIQTNPLTMQPTKEEGDKQEMNSSKPCSMSRTEKGLHLRPPWERFRYQSIEPSLCGVVVVARGVRLSTGYIGIPQSSGSMPAHLALTLEEINTLETKGCVSAPFVAPPPRRLPPGWAVTRGSGGYDSCQNSARLLHQTLRRDRSSTDLAALRRGLSVYVHTAVNMDARCMHNVY